MSLNTFTTGLSGLNANATGLSVVGHNLANLNTIGYKAGNVSFVDVLGQSIGTAIGNTINLGLGTQVGSLRSTFTAGSVQTTNNPLDVAIQGRGFLVVNDGTADFYSRAGNLHIDENNALVADNGFAVRGFLRNPVTGQIDMNGNPQDIQMPLGLNNPTVTSELEIAMNLDASAPNGSTFNTSFLIYDSLGNSHQATITFEKQFAAGPPATTRWHFDVTIPNSDVLGVSPTNPDRFSLITGGIAPAVPSAGTLVFDSTGTLVSAYLGAAPGTLPALGDLVFPAGSVTLPSMNGGGTLDPSLTWKLDPATVSSQISAYASPSEVTFSTQNGAAAGTLSNLKVEPDGTITATFSNGTTMDFARFAMALFNNVDGLEPAGNGLYRETRSSGAAFVGGPGDGGRGKLMSGALEQSNVDLATELTKIITFQRAYQANARVITTTDEIVQETMNIAR
jgi:flagellar hook protein FlgE